MKRRERLVHTSAVIVLITLSLGAAEPLVTGTREFRAVGTNGANETVTAPLLVEGTLRKVGGGTLTVPLSNVFSADGRIEVLDGRLDLTADGTGLTADIPTDVLAKAAFWVDANTNVVVCSTNLVACTTNGEDVVCVTNIFDNAVAQWLDVREPDTLHPRSNTRLEIEAGASLDGGPDPLLYPEFEPSSHWRVEYSLRRNKRAMFYAVAQTNISICGRGTINGHAELFHESTDGGKSWHRKHDQLLTGRNIFLVGCKDVTLDGFTIQSPTGWSMWLLDCDRVSVRGLRIDMDLRFPNGDGIHIGSCRDVTVSDCIVRSSDDSIILRAYQHQLNEPKACERVVIANCVLQSNASAVRIGWTHDYEIKDCRLSNLVIRDSRLGISIFMPSLAGVPNDPPRGPGVPPLPEGDAVRPFGVENVHFSDISMDCRQGPILVSFAPDTKVSRIRNLTFANMTIRSPHYPSFNLRKGDIVSDIVLSNVRFEILPGGKDSFGIRGVDHLTLDRVTFIDQTAEKATK